MLKLKLILKNSGTFNFPSVKYTFLHKLSLLFVRIHYFILLTHIDYTKIALYF